MRRLARYIRLIEEDTVSKHGLKVLLAMFAPLVLLSPPGNLLWATMIALVVGMVRVEKKCSVGVLSIKFNPD